MSLKKKKNDFYKSKIKKFNKFMTFQSKYEKYKTKTKEITKLPLPITNLLFKNLKQYCSLKDTQ